MDDFKNEVSERIVEMIKDDNLSNAAKDFMLASVIPKYSYNFSWQDRPIIQYPQDIIAMQEIIWKVRPDLIIETGIAHGGSLIFSASILAMLDMEDAIQTNNLINPRESNRMVLGIDIDIRAHNKKAIKAHPMSSRIKMIEGSSIDEDVIQQVKEIASQYGKILICLDSNHTYEHVFSELKAYAQLTSKDSYCIVFDTIIENMPSDTYPNRPWGPYNNPKTAVWEYLKTHPEFEIDRKIQNKLLITVCPDGYLKRIA
jgi:cephalosporin hydroxylase